MSSLDWREWIREIGSTILCAILFLLLSPHADGQSLPGRQLVRSILLADSTSHTAILLGFSKNESRFLFANGRDTTVLNDSIIDTEVVSSQPLLLHLKDSTKITGTLERVTEDQIPLEVEERGRVTVALEEIARFSIVVENDSSVVIHPTRRILIFPTAVPLKQGEFEVSLVEILIPQFAYGITDRVGVRAGTIVLSVNPLVWPLFMSLDGTILQSPGLDVTIGAGSAAYNSSFLEPVFDDPSFAPLLYILWSMKWDRTMISLSYHNIFDELRWGETLESLTIGGIFPLSRNYSLITENSGLYADGKDDIKWLSSLGVQHNNGKLNASFAVGVGLSHGDLSLLPMLSFTF